MIKIELVRFEAQDVITSSVPAMPLFPAKPIKPNKPQQPVEPEIPCTCYTGYPICEMNGFHMDANGGECLAKTHNCG